MNPRTLAMAADQGEGFERCRKPTPRDAVLATMEAIVPWAALCEAIEPHDPKGGNGLPPIGHCQGGPVVTAHRLNAMACSAQP